jgi:protease-4
VAFREARDNDSIKAIVLRIDSPGGSLSASEAVWREIEITRKNKPVVASMGDVAASGGYYIATACDSVVAHPATVTGSIGIFGGKMVVADLLSRLKINVQVAKRGARAGIYDLGRKFSDDEKTAIARLLGDGYEKFVKSVSDGRKIPVEKIEALAQGRVWTGRQAKERGLIDKLGGLETAIREARERAGLDAEGPLEPVLVPRDRGLLELLVESDTASRYLSMSTMEPGSLGFYRMAYEQVEALLRMGILDGRHRMVLMPYLFRVR